MSKALPLTTSIRQEEMYSRFFRERWLRLITHARAVWLHGGSGPGGTRTMPLMTREVNELIFLH